jgi:hypothetical protein
MKSDHIRTIFSVYQIWLTQERERVAANLREVCKAGQTKRQRMEKSRGGDAMRRECKFEVSLDVESPSLRRLERLKSSPRRAKSEKSRLRNVNAHGALD